MSIPGTLYFHKTKNLYILGQQFAWRDCLTGIVPPCNKFSFVFLFNMLSSSLIIIFWQIFVILLLFFKISFIIFNSANSDCHYGNEADVFNLYLLYHEL